MFPWLLMLCHGSGNLDTDGCCHVAGRPCPLRWKIVAGRIIEGPDLIDRGTVDAYINSLIQSRAGRDRAKAQVQGVTYVCRAAVEVLAADAKLLTDRAGFESAWNAHPSYVALVRPEWAKIEQSLGLASGAYQCSTWRGTAVAQCCFAEDQASNTSKTAALSTQAVTVRQAGGV